MSRSSRSKRKRSGGPLLTGPSGTLPRAQERVQQAIEDLALGGEVDQDFDLTAGMGRSPISALHRASVHQAGSARTTPYRRRFKSWQKGYDQLKRLAFPNPAVVLVCARRKIRREVMFANRVAGYKRSPGAGGSYRRSKNSSWRC